MLPKLLLSFAALVSIAAGGVRGGPMNPPYVYPARWGSSFWPDLPEVIPIPRRSQTPATTHRTPVERRQAVETGNGACGGDLPPCGVLACESHGNLRDIGPPTRYGTAKGKWQFIDSTWHGYGGYSRADEAPEDVQDARARQVYAHGAGRLNWDC